MSTSPIIKSDNVPLRWKASARVGTIKAQRDRTHVIANIHHSFLRNK